MRLPNITLMVFKGFNSLLQTRRHVAERQSLQLNYFADFHFLVTKNYEYYCYYYFSKVVRKLSNLCLLTIEIFQEGYIEELSTCFYLDTALIKSSESVLSET